MNWNIPQNVDDITLAFPAKVIGVLLPNLSEIPEDFIRGNEWCTIISKLFYEGTSDLNKNIFVKQGIDEINAKRHLLAVLGSFEPKHQHKISGAAWLMSMWYELKKESV